MVVALTEEQIEAHIHAYMSACTGGDASEISSYFEPHAVHFFPEGMYGGPFQGAKAIGDGFSAAVRNGGSAWTVDAVLVDVQRQQAAVEWTHFKQRASIVLRGCEWYVFSENGLIEEIRAYYASPQADGLSHLGLGGFDYASRRYPLDPPVVRS